MQTRPPSPLEGATQDTHTRERHSHKHTALPSPGLVTCSNGSGGLLRRAQGLCMRCTRTVPLQRCAGKSDLAVQNDTKLTEETRNAKLVEDKHVRRDTRASSASQMPTC